MPDERRVRLDEESELGTFAVPRGKRTLALGVGAWAVAAVGIAAGRSWLEMAAGVLTLLVSPLLALGAGWVVVGVRALVREGRRRRALGRRPGEHWLADYPWQPPVVHDRAGAQLVPLLARLVMGLACGAPLAVGLWVIDETGAAVVLGALTLAAGGVGVWTVGGRAMRWLRQGTSALELASFPLLPGRTVRATYRPGRRLAVGDGLRATLRFVTEEHELGDGLGRAPDVDVVCYRLHEERRGYAVPGGVVEREAGVPLEISVPVEALEREWTSRLSARPARYWQLVVEAGRPGPGLRSVFFLPVYAPGPGDWWTSHHPASGAS